MFANTPATATLPAKDLARARAWYADKLGFKPVRDRGDIGIDYDMGGTPVLLYPTQFAGTAQHTLINFRSDDLAADMKALRSRGVVFLDYDFPGLKTVDGVASFGPVRAAWCNDSEGNILGFSEGDM